MTRIQLRRDTSANWTTNNPVLASGEVGVETDTNKLKVGDGSTTWSNLSYITGDAYTKSETDDLLNKKQDKLTVVNPITLSTYVKSNLVGFSYTTDGTGVYSTNSLTAETSQYAVLSKNSSNLAYDTTSWDSNTFKSYIDIPFNFGDIITIPGNTEGYYFGLNVLFGKTLSDGTFIPIWYSTFNGTTSYNFLNNGDTGFTYTSNGWQCPDLVSPTSSFNQKSQTKTTQSLQMYQFTDNDSTFNISLINKIPGSKLYSDKYTYSNYIDRLREITTCRLFANSYIGGLPAEPYNISDIACYTGGGDLYDDYSDYTSSSPILSLNNTFDLSGQQSYNYLKLNIGDGLSVSDGALVNTNATEYTLPVATTSTLGGVIPDGSTITVATDGTISAVSSGSVEEQYGIKGDYATQYGILECPDGILEATDGTAATDSTEAVAATLTLKTGVVLQCAGQEAKTTIASDITHTVTSTSDFDLFYAEGELLECGDVFYQETEPDNGTSNYVAWWQPSTGSWQFKSNDTGNVFRTAVACRLAHIHTDGTTITRVDYIGNRILDDEIFALKSDIPEAVTVDTTFNSSSNNAIANSTVTNRLVSIQNSVSTNTSNISELTTRVTTAEGEIDTLQSTVTTQGNTFNGASQLVQLDSDGKLPAVDGSNLTNISANIDTVDVDPLFVETSLDSTLTTNFILTQLINANANKKFLCFPIPSSYYSFNVGCYLYFNFGTILDQTYILNKYIFPVRVSVDDKTGLLIPVCIYRNTSRGIVTGNSSAHEYGYGFGLNGVYGFTFNIYCPTSYASKKHLLIFSNGSSKVRLYTTSGSVYIDFNGTVVDVTEKLSSTFTDWNGKSVTMDVKWANAVSGSAAISDTDTLVISIDGEEVISYTGSDIPSIFAPSTFSLTNTYLPILNAEKANLNPQGTDWLLLDTSTYYYDADHTNKNNILVTF